MTGFDIVYRKDGGYGSDFVNSITSNHHIIGSFAGYVEFYSQPTEDDFDHYSGWTDLRVD